MEEWRPYPLNPAYSVSSLGRVRGYRGAILKPRIDVGGYVRFACCHNGDRKDVQVHRAVASAFIGPRPSNAHEINHINCVRDDNRAINLEWVTRAENTAHREKYGISSRGAENPNAKISEDDVKLICEMRAAGMTYKQISEQFPIGICMVGLIVRGLSWRGANAH